MPNLNSLNLFLKKTPNITEYPKTWTVPTHISGHNISKNKAFALPRTSVVHACITVSSIKYLCYEHYFPSLEDKTKTKQQLMHTHDQVCQS